MARAPKPSADAVKLLDHLLTACMAFQGVTRELGLSPHQERCVQLLTETVADLLFRGASDLGLPPRHDLDEV